MKLLLVKVYSPLPFNSQESWSDWASRPPPGISWPRNSVDPVNRECVMTSFFCFLHFRQFPYIPIVNDFTYVPLLQVSQSPLDILGPFSREFLQWFRGGIFPADHPKRSRRNLPPHACHRSLSSIFPRDFHLWPTYNACCQQLPGVGFSRDFSHLLQ